VATKVGTKGQVVIEQDTREKLGVLPGMLVIQRVVDDHVEVRCVPGRHNRSLAGAARPFMKTMRPDLWDSVAFEAAVEEAWGIEVTEKMRRLEAHEANSDRPVLDQARRSPRPTYVPQPIDSFREAPSNPLEFSMKDAG